MSSTHNFNLRGMPSELMALLKQEAKKLHMSTNTLVLRIIEKELGFNTKKHLHNDLDHLSGSWSDEDVEKFENGAKSFDKIDKKLWK